MLVPGMVSFFLQKQKSIHGATSSYDDSRFPAESWPRYGANTWRHAWTTASLVATCNLQPEQSHHLSMCAQPLSLHPWNTIRVWKPRWWLHLCLYNKRPWSSVLRVWMPSSESKLRRSSESRRLQVQARQRSRPNVQIESQCGFREEFRPMRFETKYTGWLLLKFEVKK
jgi:hypothetical protein